jgi:transposase InsO family protein
MRVLTTALVVSLALTACATRPQVAHEGALSSLTHQAVAIETGTAPPIGPDAILAKAIQTRVHGQVRAMGSVEPGALGPRYRLQVAVATSPGEVGISTGVGPQVGVAPWRGAPIKRHFWNRRGPVRTATLSVLDLSSGKVVAWSTVRTSSGDPADIADRLVAALTPAKA